MRISQTNEPNIQITTESNEAKYIHKIYISKMRDEKQKSFVCYVLNIHFEIQNVAFVICRQDDEMRLTMVDG